MVIFPEISEEDFKELLDRTIKQLEEIYLDNQSMPVHFSTGYVYG